MTDMHIVTPSARRQVTHIASGRHLMLQAEVHQETPTLPFASWTGLSTREVGLLEHTARGARPGGTANRWSDHGLLLAERDRVHRQIMQRGWNPQRQAFVQYYGGDVRSLPAQDRRSRPVTDEPTQRGRAEGAEDQPSS